MLRPQLRALSTFVALSLAISFMVAATSCGASQRQKTIEATLTGLVAARDGFTTWDADHEHQLVEHAKQTHATRDEVEKAVADYERTVRPKVLVAFEGAFQFLSIAAIKRDQISLTTALAKIAELEKLLKDLGVIK